MAGNSQLQLQPVPVERTYGTLAVTFGWRHGDAFAEHERSRVVDDELAQAMHRSRAVRRDANSPLLMVSVGTEAGQVGLPVGKFLRLKDVKGILPVNIAAALCVLPVTPQALARSELGPLFGRVTRMSQEIKLLAETMKRRHLIPEQAIVDSEYLQSVIFGHWKPGTPLPAAPLWQLFEFRPVGQRSTAQSEEINPGQTPIRIEGHDTPSTLSGVLTQGNAPSTSMAVLGTAVVAPQGAQLQLWGQRCPAQRVLGGAWAPQGRAGSDRGRLWAGASR